MRDWRDLNGDGIIDSAETMFEEEMLCTSRKEHIALFGTQGILVTKKMKMKIECMICKFLLVSCKFRLTCPPLSLTADQQFH